MYIIPSPETMGILSLAAWMRSKVKNTTVGQDIPWGYKQTQLPLTKTNKQFKPQTSAALAWRPLWLPVGISPCGLAVLCLETGHCKAGLGSQVSLPFWFQELFLGHYLASVFRDDRRWAAGKAILLWLEPKMKLLFGFIFDTKIKQKNCFLQPLTAIASHSQPPSTSQKHCHLSVQHTDTAAAIWALGLWLTGRALLFMPLYLMTLERRFMFAVLWFLVCKTRRTMPAGKACSGNRMRKNSVVAVTGGGRTQCSSNRRRKNSVAVVTGGGRTRWQR